MPPLDPKEYSREPSPVELHVEHELYYKDRNYSWTVRQLPYDMVVVWCERLGCVIRNEFSAFELARTSNPKESGRDIVSGINFLFNRCTYELMWESGLLWKRIEELTHELGVLNVNLEMYRKSYGYNPLAEPEPLPKPSDPLHGTMLIRVQEEFAGMEYRFGCMLDHATGGMLSKTNYTKEGMYSAIDDHVRRMEESAINDEATDEKERADAAEEKLASVQKDLDTAHRENDRLMSRLNMEGARTGLANVPGANERPQVVVQTDEDGDIG